MREDQAGLVRVDDTDERRVSFVRSIAITAAAALIGVLTAVFVVHA